jgi:uncharacterized protein (TIGR03663 family)
MSVQTNIEEVQPQENRQSASENRVFLIGGVIVTAIAAFLRFFMLELKPLHHDEGVNGYFLLELIRKGVYHYDPSNYHGPTLYFDTLVFTKLFGTETFSIRASVAVFGVLLVFLTLFLRKYIGTIGSLTAALLLALSPGMVFISRYFIHEMLFVFFSLAIVVSIVYFIEGKPAGTFATVAMSFLLLVCFIVLPFGLADIFPNNNVWLRMCFFLIEGVLVFFLMKMLLAWNEGRAAYLILASAATALFFGTKETAFITIGTMIIACFCVFAWRKIYTGLIGQITETWREPTALIFSNFRNKLGENGEAVLMLMLVTVTFIYVGVLFFSSFFTYAEGVGKAFEAYSFWTKTGVKDHSYSWTKYAVWMSKIEAPILVLSAIGGLISLATARHRFAIFTTFWAFGLAAAYSLIPYKTPWLALSFIMPMCIIAGYGINEMLANKQVTIKAFGGFILAVAVGVLSYQTYDLNFLRYDDEEMPYVYAHTKRGFHELISKIEYYAAKSGKGKDASIEIISDEYWSMPWYMRDYPKAIFHGQVIDASTSEMIVASDQKQKNELIERYEQHYKYVGTYPLRPGVDLILLVRRDLAETTDKEIYQIEGVVPKLETTPDIIVK